MIPDDRKGERYREWFAANPESALCEAATRENTDPDSPPWWTNWTVPGARLEQQKESRRSSGESVIARNTVQIVHLDWNGRRRGDLLTAVFSAAVSRAGNRPNRPGRPALAPYGGSVACHA